MTHDPRPKNTDPDLSAVSNDALIQELFGRFNIAVLITFNPAFRTGSVERLDISANIQSPYEVRGAIEAARDKYRLTPAAQIGPPPPNDPGLFE